ncbi:MAG: phosphoenolpyruvate carboxykinase (ATP) [candidate division WOR-3 bacterium]|nr:phosphoenolpyruvate carboxykinase (ATP) [candidate division WOR-3 bacterium]
MAKVRRVPPGEEPHPFNVSYIANPTQAALRRLALEHSPACYVTKYGSINKLARNKARMARYTYIIAPEPDAHLYSSKVIAPERAEQILSRVWEYVELQGKLIEIQGYYGLGERRFPIQWLYTMPCANIAGMQQILSFPREAVETPAELKEEYRPVIRVVMVPEFPLPDMPGGQAIIVDLENYTTYVIGADYFGESKKGALRMLNDYVYERGGLVLHAGAKAVTIGGERLIMTIKGLSGTGKTTTTFSKQGELTQPIQDDMVCLWPGGKISITENGAFAKTWGLKEETEPIIYNGTLDPTAWLENVYTDAEGGFDFSKGRLTPEEVKRLRDYLIITGALPENVDAYISGLVDIDDKVDEYDIPADGWDFLVWTQNGRSVIPMSKIEGAGDLRDIPPVRSMGILNRDEGPDAAMPGIVRFTSTEQAAAYFMLGETTKTSAAGKERGRTRSPFTQPFFPKAMGLQAVRFAELSAQIPDLETWLMNTGYIGGDQKDVDAGKALKVKIPHSSAMLEALLAGKIVWKPDPDFGYEIVDTDAAGNADLLEKVPKEILNPIIFFEKAGKMDVYSNWVKTMKFERREFLQKYKVAPKIVATIPE